MNYELIDPAIVWEELGDGEYIVAVVFDNSGHFRRGIYKLTDTTVNVAIELINMNNVVFFRMKER